MGYIIHYLFVKKIKKNYGIHILEVFWFQTAVPGMNTLNIISHSHHKR
jgi:hypothetical protein